MRTDRRQVEIFQDWFERKLTCFSGHAGLGTFDVNLQRKDQLLGKSLIAYLGAASEFTGTYSLKFGTIRYSCQIGSIRTGDYHCFVSDHNYPTKRRQGHFSLHRSVPGAIYVYVPLIG
jgi:hypothetical protein